MKGCRQDSLKRKFVNLIFSNNQEVQELLTDKTIYIFQQINEEKKSKISENIFMNLEARKGLS